MFGQNRLVGGLGSWLREHVPTPWVRFANRIFPRRLERPRVLAGNPRVNGPYRHRSAVLNLVAQERSAKSYLEIGVHRGLTFERIAVASRTGVEPAPNFDVHKLPSGTEMFLGTSDEFFRAFPELRFDLIFIDGLHEFSQVASDFINSLAALADGGVIAIDDTWPRDAVGSLPDQGLAMELREKSGSAATEWWGDVWKLVLALHSVGEGLDWCTVTHGLDGSEVHGMTLVWKTLGTTELTVNQFETFLDASFSDYFPEATEIPSFLRGAALSRLGELLEH